MNEALFFIFTYIYVYEHRKRLVFIKRTRERLNEARAFYNCCKTLRLDRSKLKKKKKELTLVIAIV